MLLVPGLWLTATGAAHLLVPPRIAEGERMGGSLDRPRVRLWNVGVALAVTVVAGLLVVAGAARPWLHQLEWCSLPMLVGLVLTVPAAFTRTALPHPDVATRVVSGLPGSMAGLIGPGIGIAVLAVLRSGWWPLLMSVGLSVAVVGALDSHNCIRLAERDPYYNPIVQTGERLPAWFVWLGFVAALAGPFGAGVVNQGSWAFLIWLVPSLLGLAVVGALLSREDVLRVGPVVSGEVQRMQDQERRERWGLAAHGEEDLVFVRSLVVEGVDESGRSGMFVVCG
jgi:hypothetical protein